ncbi:acyl-CoA dehydrogenase family protein [Oceanicola sp. 22II-s10i]|uniref:acyl-CoA dehydrogenase family protein n=1 Tax=Oceanicola sp. 22II-s10i TaxID=1317116 RepID=UPI000B524070|nr:acyl-CoA dehydrogenase family protein [Oceanicola sp. 22II-s10i]
MRFEPNDSQATFAGVLGQMLAAPQAGFQAVPDWGRFDYGDRLDRQLAENGFFDAATEDDLGPVAAALMVHNVARAAVCVECAASALVRPFLGREVPRPLAVVVDDAPGAIRYLPQARGLVSITADAVHYADLPEGAVTRVDSLYAYPMGTVDRAALDWQRLDADPARLRALWQVAVAAELAGLLGAGTEAVIEHVSQRHQFGQPLGAFQGIQHRLATAAVEIDGARLQALRAAQSGGIGDAAAALGYAQGIATRIGYDLHQFMGAMGMTLEHPLHRWTYRARLLRADMGGSAASYLAYADARWGAA